MYSLAPTSTAEQYWTDLSAGVVNSDKAIEDGVDKPTHTRKEHLTAILVVYSASKELGLQRESDSST